MIEVIFVTIAIAIQSWVNWGMFGIKYFCQKTHFVLQLWFNPVTSLYSIKFYRNKTWLLFKPPKGGI